MYALSYLLLAPDLPQNINNIFRFCHVDGTIISSISEICMIQFDCNFDEQQENETQTPCPQNQHLHTTIYFCYININIWNVSCNNKPYRTFEKWRSRSTCVSMPSIQSPHYLPVSLVSWLLLSEQRSPDQPAQMHRLIWASAVRICVKVSSFMTHLI